MTRKLRPLAALATVALIGAGGADSFAADGKTESKRPPRSSAPGRTLPPKRSSKSKWLSSAPGKLPPKR